MQAVKVRRVVEINKPVFALIGSPVYMQRVKNLFRQLHEIGVYTKAGETSWGLVSYYLPNAYNAIVFARNDKQELVFFAVDFDTLTYLGY